MMNTTVLIEEPMFTYEGSYEGEIVLYASDLRKAKVGDRWDCVGGKYNRDTLVTARVVYKDEHGLLLTLRGDLIELIWFELH